MAVIDGGEFRVKVGSKVVAFATSSTINVSSAIDVVANTSVSTKTIVKVTPGRKTASVNTNALMGVSDNYDFGDLWDAWLNDSLVSLEFAGDTNGQWSLAGSAYIGSLSSTTPVSQDASIRVKFDFSGAVNLTVING